MDVTNLPLTLTVDEAAAELRVSRRMVFKLLQSGALAGVKIGRTRRITRASLGAYLDHLSTAS